MDGYGRVRTEDGDNDDDDGNTTPKTRAGGGPIRKVKNKGKTFQCTGFGDCEMTFTRSEHLLRHIRKHTGERPFSCHCGRTFSRLDNLRQHAQTVHANEQIPADSPAATAFANLPLQMPPKQSRHHHPPNSRQQRQQRQQQRQEEEEEEEVEVEEEVEAQSQQQHQLQQGQQSRSRQNPMMLPDYYGSEMSPPGMGTTMTHGYRHSPYTQPYNIKQSVQSMSSHGSGMSAGWARTISMKPNSGNYSESTNGGVGPNPAVVMFESLIDPELVADDEAEKAHPAQPQQRKAAQAVLKGEATPEKKEPRELREKRDQKEVKEEKVHDRREDVEVNPKLQPNFDKADASTKDLTESESAKETKKEAAPVKKTERKAAEKKKKAGGMGKKEKDEEDDKDSDEQGGGLDALVEAARLVA